MTQSSPFGVTLAMTTNQFGQLDIDPTGATVTGRTLLAQRLVLRQSTPQGSVVDAPNDCFDLRDWISNGLTTSQINQLPAQISGELLKDQGVLGCNVSVSFSYATSTLTVTENVQSAYGPFSLTLTVTPSAVSFLVGKITNQGAI